jgi:hypothetical protein
MTTLIIKLWNFRASGGIGGHLVNFKRRGIIYTPTFVLD